ncbi:hypothetical protein BDV96DRAFT_611764 [Lophiotrema nucula]|uniref:Fe2OG dioxygenase domain-containing protein n=1 Tax=Lophiotrema nucula TaxID=690887 RepID=A0A6A5ZG04_9PLEO|nr:hypothetical protein BDV96DRAFT_611764 [Lophiotrema nucula]
MNEHRTSIAEALGAFVESKSVTFACGGTIAVASSNDDAADGTSSQLLRPFALRWDSVTEDGELSKLSFPVNMNDDISNANLLKLVKDCQPASFGYKGADVLDESYRKAIKLDRSVFSIDFCPYESGIVDTIAQMPAAQAELYKLNIYAAPSGFFKAHVDTPRSNTQFGSLVVSLPCDYQGGQLIVRHAQHTVSFDWGASTANNTSATAMNWAAFYSDCEHEVLGVTEGYRVTLTYNLYCAAGSGDLTGNSPAMDVKLLPLYAKVKEALAQSDFLQYGGLLGVYCQHGYAHTTSEGAAKLPGILKGSDMAIYSVFKGLGLEVSVKSVLDILNNSLFDPSDYDDYMSGEDNSDGDIDENTETKLRKPRWWDGSYLKNIEGDVVVAEVGGYEESVEEILGVSGARQSDVLWLTRPIHGNVGMVHLTYGNEAGINCLYTHAALIIEIPPASRRTDSTDTTVMA